MKKIKPLKLKLDRFHVTKIGDRTLTPAQKRKLKEVVGYRCQKCHKEFDARYLQIHHKKSIASYKNKITGVDLPVYTLGRKHIPNYDRQKSKLEVVCLKCHDKTKKKRKKKKPVWQHYF
ncbi:MAG: cytochrome c3 family protein [Nanoarchaeota archaeon]|nr:cytochrome c3 family protein [Nanoarchaeota archaeon]